jgi:hypothetical protein
MSENILALANPMLNMVFGIAFLILWRREPCASWIAIISVSYFASAAGFFIFHLTPDLHALARTHEAAPVEEGGIVHPQELYSLVVGEEPGRDYPRVVEDQEVVLPEEGGEPGEEAVLDRAPLPVNDHHA